jgi:hypothetical protein
MGSRVGGERASFGAPGSRRTVVPGPKQGKFQVPRVSRSTCKQRDKVEGVQNGDALFSLLADLEEGFLFSPANKEGRELAGYLGLQRRGVGVK